MKKKIIAISIIGMFLLTGLTAVSVVGRETATTGSDNTPPTPERAYLAIHVTRAGLTPLPGVKVTCEGQGPFNDYKHTEITDENGHVKFGYKENDILTCPGIYIVTGEKEGYVTRSIIVDMTRWCSVGTSLWMFKDKSFNSAPANPALLSLS